ncbi:hypothetical protein CVT24_004858 [Panaeolus cyanescens]|uniref:Major facilitator superfamily (MFS) profile domain-containing protein n=1 Tax=Panaeolus cyanescens TaxID=181874 RepID=A0A409V9V2_9AGAR|nr:hypothetical protein CVT24_004858 [Panaeolus cyanescens]
MSNLVDEETPLLHAEPPKERKPTPLPKLQIAICLLLQVCEPIASQSIYPYINQLISELGVTGGDDRKVGYYAGLIESLFFLTEATTVLQWSRASDHIGRKPVLLIGLFGLTISMLCFGLSRTFTTLVISRCLTGLLNGNIGVMKSVMGELTDSTNRAEGFSLMPVVWGFGSTIGPLIGGTLARPHERFPKYFSGTFWKTYPYFLPCLVPAVVVMMGFTITLIFFKEVRSIHALPFSLILYINQTIQKRSQGGGEIDDKPVPLRKLLTYRVVLSVSNYVVLAFLNIALYALLPLFLAMPLEIGGLNMDPPAIGYILGALGILLASYQAVFFAKIVRYFGERTVFIASLSTYLPVFALLPMINMAARSYGTNSWPVWILIGMVLVLLAIMDMAYGTIFMYITSSPPSKRALGATNGLSQTTVSIARAIGPALSTSLFSYSVEHNILGGYGVYFFLMILSCFALVLACRLPPRPWDHEDTPPQTPLVSTLDIIGGDTRKIGYYAGLIESLFFATEALTVFQWSRMSDRIGRKPVLMIGMIGTMLSMICFGLSRTFATLVISRCLCGLLNGNIGVMKSAMGELTDSTNRADAFALMPVVWAFGATMGPLIGGSLARPADRFPSIFTGTFWKEFPYFLPCLGTVLFVFVTFIITGLFFKETAHHAHGPKRSLSRSSSSSSSDTLLESQPTSDEQSVGFRGLLIFPVIISIANYVTLAFFNISVNALLPLFFHMPIDMGGLNLEPAAIGYIMGIYGAGTGLFQILFFAKLVRGFGTRRVFIWSMASFIPVFMLFPVISLVAKTWDLCWTVWVLVGLILLLLFFMDTAYGCIFMYVTESAPNRRSLGATNGLAQTTVSFARALGPALSTSLYSFSIQTNLLGGYGVYAILATLGCLALILASQLPMEPWQKEEEGAHQK